MIEKKSGLVFQLRLQHDLGYCFIQTLDFSDISPFSGKLIYVYDYFVKEESTVNINEIEELAFDHMEILQAALKKLKEKIRIQPIGFNLLPEKFTLGQLHKLYEAILDKQIDKRNFRRKILKLDILTSLDEKQKGVAHKPSKFVKFNERKYNKLTETGFDNFSF